LTVLNTDIPSTFSGAKMKSGVKEKIDNNPLLQIKNEKDDAKPFLLL
jgi:hypothetical protein